MFGGFAARTTLSRPACGRECDVVRDPRTQQADVLEDEGLHPTELLTAQLPQIHTAQDHRAAGRVEEPW